jgi:hypothetical protein
MSGKFLRSAFRVVDLPVPVVPAVLSIYKPQYAEFLAYNQSLGDRGVSLVSPKLPVESLGELIGAGSRAVLECVLDSRERRHEALARILRTWRLSREDQLRFVNRKLGTYTRDLLLDFGYFERDVLDLADIEDDSEDEMLARGFVDGAIDPLFGGPGDETVLYGECEPWKAMFGTTFNTMEELLDMSIPSFGGNTDVALCVLNYAGRHFSAYLGSGSSPVDVRAWMLFFSLAESDPDVPLKSVMLSARRLAVAESHS